MPLPKKSTPDAPPRAAPPLERILAELPRPVGLLGFGEEGRATLAFLKGHGVTDAAVFDRATSLGDESEAALLEGVPLHSGERYDQQLSDCGTVFRSPGVRPDLPGLERARRGGVRITSATRLFLEACPARTVGVTGTVGKGTTVTLIGEALGAADIPHRLGGNLGTNPLAFLDELTPAHVAVLELSSFQLMDLEGHWPDVAVVLRTTSEHLDWHRDVREYRRAKARILAPPEAGQRAVYCADSPGSREIMASAAGEAPDYSLAYSLTGAVARGVGTVDGRLVRCGPGDPAPLEALERIALRGRFNRENAAAALLAAESLGVPAKMALPAIAAFPGLPHRLEAVGRVGRVLCVNDSYATRPDSTIGALSAFEDGPLALILGGSEKHADFAALSEALCRHPTLRGVLLIGDTAPRLAEELDAAAQRLGLAGPPAERSGGLEEAFRRGLGALPEGGVLLLSPACASFGLFPNYKVRGERFRALVEDFAAGGAAAPAPTPRG